MDETRMTIDPESGKPIRPTDNGLKDCDREAPQSPEPLSLSPGGLPEGWEVPDGDR